MVSFFIKFGTPVRLSYGLGGFTAELIGFNMSSSIKIIGCVLIFFSTDYCLGLTIYFSSILGLFLRSPFLMAPDCQCFSISAFSLSNFKSIYLTVQTDCALTTFSVGTSDLVLSLYFRTSQFGGIIVLKAFERFFDVVRNWMFDLLLFLCPITLGLVYL